MELEWHQIEFRYQNLHLPDRRRERQLALTLVEHGQQNPVVVVESDGGYVLIDGYLRAAVLRQLGRDTVQAVVLPMAEAEALVWSWSVARGGRWSALAEGWLLRLLSEQHGLSQTELAERFGRSPSWVSRRLALAQVLPAAVEDLVRRGTVSPHGAMRSLVPLARANPEDAERLAAGLRGASLSTRQLERLYQAWRGGEAKEREAILSAPLLFLRALEELEGGAAERPPEGPEDQFERELEILAGHPLRRAAPMQRVPAHRARRWLRQERKRRGGIVLSSRIGPSWEASRRAFYALESTVSEEGCHVGA